MRFKVFAGASVGSEVEDRWASLGMTSMRWLSAAVSPRIDGRPSTDTLSYSPVRAMRRVRVSETPRPGPVTLF